MTGTALIKAALAVALATGVHLAAFAAMPDAGASAPSAGDGGDSLVTLAAADGALSALVADWTRPPQTTATAPEAPRPPGAAQAPVAPALTAPQFSAPQMSAPQMPAVLALDLPAERAPLVAPVPPEPTAAPERSPKPKPRPKAEPKAAPAPAAAPAQKASGSGRASAAGTEGRAQTATLSRAQTNSLKATWGGAIRARIEAKKRSPAVRAAGKVTLRLTIARNGTLRGVSVTRSSGNASLDAAAVAAVQRAGRFPAAPSGLAEPSYSFTLPISFSR